MYIRSKQKHWKMLKIPEKKIEWSQNVKEVTSSKMDLVNQTE